MRNLIFLQLPFILAALVSSCDGQQPFSVKTEVVTVIEATGQVMPSDGKSYLISDGKRVRAVIIDTQQEGLRYLIVRKLAGGRSVLLKESFDGGKFLFVGVENGEYEIQPPVPEGGYPEFDHFTISEGEDPEEPPTNPDPEPQPEPSDFSETIRKAVKALPEDAQSIRGKLRENIEHVRGQWTTGVYQREGPRDSFIAMSVAIANLNQLASTPEQFRAWSPVWKIVQTELTNRFNQQGASMDIVAALTEIIDGLSG